MTGNPPACTKEAGLGRSPTPCPASPVASLQGHTESPLPRHPEAQAGCGESKGSSCFGWDTVRGTGACPGAFRRPTSASSGWKVRMSTLCSTHLRSLSGIGYCGRKLGSCRREFLKTQSHKFSSPSPPGSLCRRFWSIPIPCARSQGVSDSRESGSGLPV